MVATSPANGGADPVGGRYDLAEVIGSGGMATVYSAKDLNLRRDVALKLFPPQPADPEEIKRRAAEIDLLADLNHPGLVTLFDAGTDTRTAGEPRPFLAMELVSGQDLRARIRRGPLPLDELAVIGTGIAEALAYVHSRGIIHRDLKPANILLVEDQPGQPPRPKLTDFGLARSLDASRLTSAGTMLGTAAYLSPEQARGGDIGPASDIYSFGLVLLECLKGELEYPGTAVESAVARLQRPPAIPGSAPDDWSQLLREMTAPNPEDRPSAGDVAAAIRRPQAAPEPPLEEGATAHRTIRIRLPRPRKLSRLTWIVVLLAAALLLTGGALLAATVTAAPPAAPAVIPYPKVTGAVGDLLNELQRSVEP